MPLSYYTIDDMSLPRKRLFRKGWTVQHFDTLEEAIYAYKEIPPSKDKRLGLTDSIHTLELVRCVPLFSFDTEGEDILASDYRQCRPSGWRNPGRGGCSATNTCPAGAWEAGLSVRAA